VPRLPQLNTKARLSANGCMRGVTGLESSKQDGKKSKEERTGEKACDDRARDRGKRGRKEKHACPGGKPAGCPPDGGCYLATLGWMTPRSASIFRLSSHV
jgi:hypothetical protein